MTTWAGEPSPWRRLSGARRRKLATEERAGGGSGARESGPDSMNAHLRSLFSRAFQAGLVTHESLAGPSQVPLRRRNARPLLLFRPIQAVEW